MRRCTAAGNKRARVRGVCLLLFAALLAGALWLNRYVNTKVKPTLHELAEYEARAATVQAVNNAVAAELLCAPSLCTGLFHPARQPCQPERQCCSRRSGAAYPCRAGRDERPAGDVLHDSLRQPDRQFAAERPRPGWRLSLQPKGYVQGEIQEITESLSINTTRYSAVLQLSVTVNMILDGSTATLTVETEYPLVSLLIGGNTPGVYASDCD